MDLSPIGEAVLVAREGRRLKAYRDSVGVWTIGVGHTSAAGPPAVRSGLSITAAECEAIFARDVERYVGPVRDALAGLPLLPPHAFDALVSLCFNIGPGAFLRSSVLRRLRAGDRAGAAEAILAWNRPAAVIARRQAEYDQFRTPYETALPRARRGDAHPIPRPAGPAPGGQAPSATVPEAAPQAVAPEPLRTGLARPLARFLARLRGFPRVRIRR